MAVGSRQLNARASRLWDGDHGTLRRVSPQGRSFNQDENRVVIRLRGRVVSQFGSIGESETSELRGLKSVTTPWGEIEHVPHQTDETKYQKTCHNNHDCEHIPLRLEAGADRILLPGLVKGQSCSGSSLNQQLTGGVLAGFSEPVS
jgi:hypothetical protein